MQEAVIRLGVPGDLTSLVRIYNHYVENSHVTFDTKPFDVAERTPWLARFGPTGPYQLFVAESASRAVGYACSTPFKEKPAYSISVETTVYLDPECVGRGLGRRLCEALLEALGRTEVHGAYAAIALPNPASIALHERLGFRAVGTLQEVGRKFGKLWSVAWYERRLGSAGES
jgi:phosphinothricin acetyltransferase